MDSYEEIAQSDLSWAQKVAAAETLGRSSGTPLVVTAAEYAALEHKDPEQLYCII